MIGMLGMVSKLPTSEVVMMWILADLCHVGLAVLRSNFGRVCFHQAAWREFGFTLVATRGGLHISVTWLLGYLRGRISSCEW